MIQITLSVVSRQNPSTGSNPRLLAAINGNEPKPGDGAIFQFPKQRFGGHRLLASASADFAAGHFAAKRLEPLACLTLTEVDESDCGLPGHRTIDDRM